MEPGERAALLVVDQLHDRNDVDESAWSGLMDHFTDVQALDLILLAGWYHAISFVARATRVPHEAGTPHFVDYGDQVPPGPRI